MALSADERARRQEAQLAEDTLWEAMVERDPALGKLERRARGLRPYLKHRNVLSTFDRMFKLEINRLVGWAARSAPEEHRTSAAYDAAYNRILGILQGSKRYDIVVTVTRKEREPA